MTDYVGLLGNAIETLKSATAHGTADRAGGAVLSPALLAQETKGSTVDHHPLQYTPKVESKAHQIADDLTKRLGSDTVALSVDRATVLEIIEILEGKQ